MVERRTAIASHSKWNVRFAPNGVISIGLAPIQLNYPNNTTSRQNS